MTRFHRTALALGLALGIVPLAQAADLPDARKLIDAHIAAIGGRDALMRSSDGTSKVQMEILENGMKVEMTLYGRGNDRAMVMPVPGAGDFRSGYSGGVAWSMDPMNGPRLLQGKERDQQVEQSDPRYAVRDASVITSAKTVALSESEGRPCYRVEIEWISGRQTTECYSSENGLLLSTESIATTAMGDLKQVTHMSDYRDYGKVKVASRMKNQVAGMTQILTILSVDPTTPAPEVFALPPAIQALTKKAAEGQAGAEK